jgi:hypothetical protein
MRALARNDKEDKIKRKRGYDHGRDEFEGQAKVNTCAFTAETRTEREHIARAKEMNNPPLYFNLWYPAEGSFDVMDWFYLFLCNSADTIL